MILEELPDFKYGDLVEIVKKNQAHKPPYDLQRHVFYILGTGVFEPTKTPYLEVCRGFKGNEPLQKIHFQIDEAIQVRIYKPLQK